MSVTFLKQPRALILASLKRFINFVDIGRRRNIDGIKQPLSDTQINVHAFVGTAQSFQYVPIRKDAGLSGLYQKHVRRVSSSVNNVNKVTYNITFNEPCSDDVKIAYAFRKER